MVLIFLSAWPFQLSPSSIALVFIIPDAQRSGTRPVRQADRRSPTWESLPNLDLIIPAAQVFNLFFFLSAWPFQLSPSSIALVFIIPAAQLWSRWSLTSATGWPQVSKPITFDLSGLYYPNRTAPNRGRGRFMHCCFLGNFTQQTFPYQDPTIALADTTISHPSRSKSFWWVEG